MQLIKKREKEKEETEQRKRKMAEETKIAKIDNKFAAHYDAIEQQLKTSTIGLVTLDEMKAKQTDVVAQRERELAQKQKAERDALQAEARRAEELKRFQRDTSKLSFAFEEDENDDEESKSPQFTPGRYQFVVDANSLLDFRNFCKSGCRNCVLDFRVMMKF